MSSDAGSGQGGLTHADQAWVSIVPNLTGWMGQMAPPNSAQEKHAFSLFVLAAAHDAGMNTMDGINLVTSGSRLAVIIAILSILIPIPGLAVLLAKSPQKIMLALAMTQKETTTSMLSMGVRFVICRSDIWDERRLKISNYTDTSTSAPLTFSQGFAR